MRAGPMDGVTLATCPSGMVVGRFSGPATTSGSVSRSAIDVRDSGASRIVTSRVSPDGSIQSPASMPANAGRSAWATWPTVMPSVPASARSSCTSNSGFCPFVDRLTSTAPATIRTSAMI